MDDSEDFNCVPHICVTGFVFLCNARIYCKEDVWSLDRATWCQRWKLYTAVRYNELKDRFVTVRPSIACKPLTVHV